MSKPKVGFCWFASCGGCEEAIVDLNEAILDVVEAVDIVLWPCAMDFKYEDVEMMDDGEMTVCFVNGAIRTSEEEEIAHLLRRKSQLLIAFGSCAHMGGIPGMGNFFDHTDILRHDFLQTPTVVNENKVFPLPESFVPEGMVTLPAFLEVARTMDQTVAVDYYLPGCPPPVRLIQSALQAILTGQLPERGTVLAPDMALCHECPRKETKPEKISLTSFKRPHEVIVDDEQCLLAQGLLCLGPLTRCGCDGACTTANMPCTGCLGPTSIVRDYGAKALSAMASVLEAREEDRIDEALASIVDPLGTFNRYSFASSYMHSCLHKTNGAEK